MSKEVSTNIVQIREYLSKHKDQFALALPKHITADRMSRLALTAISRDKKLAACDAKSLFAAVVIASQLGLEIGVGGQGFLVPYKGTATFVPGWQGLVDLVSRAGRATVWTGAVFDGDYFDFALGDSPFVKHRPAGEDDWRKITHVYAVGRVNNAQWPIIEVWPIARIWRHRDKHNKVGADHYSYKNPEMYARKIPLLQVLKYLPKSTELSAAIAASDAQESGSNPVIDSDFVVSYEQQQDVDKETGEVIPPQNGNGNSLADKLKAAQPTPAHAPTVSPANTQSNDEFFKEYDDVAK